MTVLMKTSRFHSTGKTAKARRSDGSPAGSQDRRQHSAIAGSTASSSYAAVAYSTIGQPGARGG